MPRTAPAPSSTPELRTATAGIIDQLNAVRGSASQIDLDLDDESTRRPSLAAIAGEEELHDGPDASTGPISARIYSLASARTKAEAPSEPRRHVVSRDRSRSVCPSDANKVPSGENPSLDPRPGSSGR